MSQYFHLKATVPYLGEQLVGYLYTDPQRALALQLALQQCPGAQYTLTDDRGSPVVPAYSGGGGQQGGNPFPWLPQSLNPWANRGGNGGGHGGGGWGY